MKRGLAAKDVLLALLVLLACAAILYPIYRRTQSETVTEVGISNMRSIFVAWAIYEQNNLGPPPDLLSLRMDIPSDAAYLSLRDPYFDAKAEAYPLVPGHPEWKEQSPLRISFDYLLDYVAAGIAEIPPWQETRLNAELGLISSGWGESAEATGGFRAKVSSPVVRVRMDGSVETLPFEGTLGDPDRLFFRR